MEKLVFAIKDSFREILGVLSVDEINCNKKLLSEAQVLHMALNRF